MHLRIAALLLLAACSGTATGADVPDAAQCEPGVRYDCDCGARKGLALCSADGRKGGCECGGSTTTSPIDDAGTPDADEPETCAPPPASTASASADCTVVPGGCPVSCGLPTRYACPGDARPSRTGDGGELACQRLATGETCCESACVRHVSGDGACFTGRPAAYHCPTLPDGGLLAAVPADCSHLDVSTGYDAYCCAQ